MLWLQETMNKITEYSETAVLPFGCTTEKLSILPPEQIFHEEVPYHIQTGMKIISNCLVLEKFMKI